MHAPEMGPDPEWEKSCGTGGTGVRCFTRTYNCPRGYANILGHDAGTGFDYCQKGNDKCSCTQYPGDCPMDIEYTEPVFTEPTVTDTPLPADDQSFIRPTDKNTFVAMLAEIGIGIIKAVQTVIGLFGAGSA